MLKEVEHAITHHQTNMHNALVAIKNNSNITIEGCKKLVKEIEDTLEKLEAMDPNGLDNLREKLSEVVYGINDYQFRIDKLIDEYKIK